MSDGGGEKRIEKWATILIHDLCTSHGQNLDEPVVEYLANMLVDLSSEEVDEEFFLETMNNYFSKPLGAEAVQKLLKELSSPVESRLSELHTMTMIPSDQCLQENLLSMNISSSNLKPTAKAFIPSSASEANTEDGFIQGEDLAAFIGQYLDDPSNDPVELLREMFPFISRMDIESVYNQKHQSFSSALETLLEMKDTGEWTQHNDSGVFHPDSLDFSDEAFPDLLSTRRAKSLENGSTGGARIESKESFSDIVKKKTAGPLPLDQGQNLVTAPQPSGTKQTMVATGDKRGKQKAQNQGTIPWVVTGEAVSKQYAQLRAAASEFAKLRNACFSEATKAYVAGNKALAKELGEKGRIYCEKMKACHHEASESIFRDRNQQLRKMMNENSPEAIDLHGLHVAEARRILERELSKMQEKKARGRRKAVHLLVGTGHHTKGSRTPSRLPSAVEEFLKEHGFAFCRSMPGVIEVEIYE